MRKPYAIILTVLAFVVPIGLIRLVERLLYYHDTDTYLSHRLFLASWLVFAGGLVGLLVLAVLANFYCWLRKDR